VYDDGAIENLADCHEGTRLTAKRPSARSWSSRTSARPTPGRGSCSRSPALTGGDGRP